MKRYRLTRPTCGLALAATAAVGCTDSSTVTVPGPAFSEVTAVLVVWPDFVEVMPGDQQVFTAYLCPLDVDGNWDAGPDGVPGTSDDLCFPVTAAWSVEGDIGAIAPTTGGSTTLTASLPEGSTLEMGTVRATLSDQSADAEVYVVDGEPIGQSQYAPCVQFTSQRKKMGKKICRAGSSYIAFTFDSGKGLLAEFGNEEPIVAPEKANGLKLTFDGKKVVAANWLNGNVGTPITIKPSKEVNLKFPRESGGAITAAAWSGPTAIRPLPTPPAGQKIDDAHVWFEKVEESKKAR